MVEDGVEVYALFLWTLLLLPPPWGLYDVVDLKTMMTGNHQLRLLDLLTEQPLAVHFHLQIGLFYATGL